MRRQGLKADERLRFAHAVALRTDTCTYVGWTDGEHEAKDHATDPDWRGNAYGALAPATTSALWDLPISEERDPSGALRPAAAAPIEIRIASPPRPGLRASIWHGWPPRPGKPYGNVSAPKAGGELTRPG